jgi:hypothetical protein
MGVVHTNTTELAMEVYSREVIHVAKWIARNKPESNERKMLLLVSFFNSPVCLISTIGTSGKVEMIILAAAITSEFASDCA